MAELKRKEEELTTADLAGTAQPEKVEEAKGPTLVRPGERAASRPAGTDEEAPSPLFSEGELGDFRTRWSDIQAGFVDEPRKAVEQADSLVASIMKRLAEGFANERSGLEKQWGRGDDVSTEDLRVALRRYRSFFDRLLKV